MSAPPTASGPVAADLYCELYAPPLSASRFDRAPGLILIALATLAAAFLASRLHVSLTLTALLIGLSLNFLESDARLSPGLDFASRTLLRWGIVLLGARITFAEFMHLGLGSLAAILVIAGSTMTVGLMAARWLGYDKAFGVVAGGAVAICGASAALALAEALGSHRVSSGQLTQILVATATFSAFGMIAYPVICHLMNLDDGASGFVFGAAIHDVAQSLGAAYGFSVSAGHTATVVKLTRVTLLAPIVVMVCQLFPQAGQQRARLALPWFIVGFFILAIVNSFDVFPDQLSEGAGEIANAFLVCAVTATGVRSPIRKLLSNSWRPLLVIASASGVALALSLIAVKSLGL